MLYFMIILNYEELKDEEEFEEDKEVVLTEE